MPTKNHNLKKGRAWRARIRSFGKDIYLGTFDTYDEALAMENRARKRIGQGWQGMHSIGYERDAQGRFRAAG